MLRSVIFTGLLDLAPEFGRLTSDDGSRVVTDATERVSMDMANDLTVTVWKALTAYVQDIQGTGDPTPGVWQRYVATLREMDRLSPPCQDISHARGRAGQ